MSDNQNMGFGKFVPGFDFLQNIAKGASQSLPQMPSLTSWVAPTLNVEELEKRIGEMKAVHFWLDQNSRALGATIQALEVQKMTLATLKGMNFNMNELANAMKLKATDAMMGGLKRGAGGDGAGANAGEKVDANVDARGDAADSSEGAGTPDEASAASPGAKAAGKSASTRSGAKKADGGPAASIVDPMQWWGSLTQQFQQIAATAMKDAATQATATDATRNMATSAAKRPSKTASGTATGVAAGAAKRAKKAPAKRAKKKGGA